MSDKIFHISGFKKENSLNVEYEKWIVDIFLL